MKYRCFMTFGQSMQIQSMRIVFLAVVNLDMCQVRQHLFAALPEGCPLC